MYAWCACAAKRGAAFCLCATSLTHWIFAGRAQRLEEGRQARDAATSARCGPIHAEIKKQVLHNGRLIQHAQFHITIADVWQKNEAFFSGRKCSESEQSVDASKRSVRHANALCSDSERSDGEGVQNLNGNCSESGTRVRLQGKITDSSKITEEATDPSGGSSSESEHAAAAAVVFSVESLTQEEIALIQAYRQGTLNVISEPSENLGEPASAPVESKHAESMAQETSTEAVERPGVPGEGEETQVPLTRIAAITAAEEVVQMWEQIRGVHYEQRERIMQLRAATTLLGMELARPLTPESLETLYSTYYDDFWKKKYGELHLTHLVEVEKSSGQVRVVRWVKRLGFQSLPTRSSSGSAEERAAGGPEPFKPMMDFANYRQEEERDLVGDYAAGKMTEKELAAYSPGMLDVLKRHAAARMAASGGVR